MNGFTGMGADEIWRFLHGKALSEVELAFSSIRSRIRFSKMRMETAVRNVHDGKQSENCIGILAFDNRVLVF